MGTDDVWVALQTTVLATLRQRREQLIAAGANEDELGFLADHVADDLLATFVVRRRTADE